MVEFGELELIHRDLLDICVGLVNAPSQRGWIHWTHEPEFCTDADGDNVWSHEDSDQSVDTIHRSVSELWTSDWWRDTEAAIPGFNVSNVPTRILAMGIATDETAITLTGQTNRQTLCSALYDIFSVYAKHSKLLPVLLFLVSSSW